MKKFLVVFLAILLAFSTFAFSASAALMKGEDVSVVKDGTFTIQHFPGYAYLTKLVFSDGSTHVGAKFDGSGQVYAVEKFETKLPNGEQVASFCSDFGSVSIEGLYEYDAFGRDMTEAQKTLIIAAFDFINDLYGIENTPAGRAVAQLVAWNILLGDEGYDMPAAGRKLVKFEGYETWYTAEYAAIVDSILNGSIDVISIYNDKLANKVPGTVYISDLFCIVGVSGDNYWQQRQLIPAYEVIPEVVAPQLGSLTVDIGDSTMKTTTEIWKKIWQRERTAQAKNIVNSGGTVTATNANYKSVMSFDANGGVISDKKNPSKLLVPNSNHFAYAVLDYAALQRGESIPLAMVVGNNVDQIGTASVKLENGMLKIDIDSWVSGDAGAVAFNNLSGAPKNGNIHSMNKEKDMKALGAAAGVTRFDHNNNLTIPCPSPDKDGNVYLYIHSGSMDFDKTDVNDPNYDPETGYIWGPWSEYVQIGEERIASGYSVTNFALDVNVTVTDWLGNEIFNGTANSALTFEGLQPGAYTVAWSWEYNGETGSGTTTVAVEVDGNTVVTIPGAEFENTVKEYTSYETDEFISVENRPA